LSNPPSNASSTTCLSTTTNEVSEIQRSLVNDIAKGKKKRRRTSKQKNEADALKAKRKKQESKAAKFATKQIAFTQQVSPSHTLFGRL